jgi:ABC-type sugar transport system ATPase subunit
MRAEIIRLHQRLGKTMVYVTHDQIEAMTMSSRIAVLEGGRLLQLGTPAEIYARPANRFVAGFVGTPRMNFLQGRLAPDAHGSVFRADGQALEVMLPEVAARAGKIMAGVRPQDLLPAETGLPATVSLLESTGQETLVTVTAGEADFVLRLDENCRLRIGDRICLTVRPGRLHLFDTQTGDRIGT